MQDVSCKGLSGGIFGQPRVVPLHESSARPCTPLPDERVTAKMESNASLEKCFMKTDSIVSRKFGNEFIMASIQRKAGKVESAYSLNEVAASVRELNDDGNRSVEQVRDSIVAEFEVIPAHAGEDIIEILLQLSEIGPLQEH
jgi:hypothetical protein